MRGSPSCGSPPSSQVNLRVEIVRGLLKGPMGTGHAGSVFGENSFHRETSGTRRRGLHVAKRSSDPRQAYPEVKLQGRDLVRVVGIVTPFAPLGVGTRGNSFYRTPGEKLAEETCAGCP